MAKEPCNAWSLANNNRSTAALAPTLVKELEVFVARLAASTTGAPVRPKVCEPRCRTRACTCPPNARDIRVRHAHARCFHMCCPRARVSSQSPTISYGGPLAAHSLRPTPPPAADAAQVLVAGWESQVATAGFVKREFRFHDSPDTSLGFKLLPRPEAKSTGATDAKGLAADPKADTAADAPEASTASATPADAVGTKRKRPEGVGDSPATQGAAGKRAAPLNNPFRSAEEMREAAERATAAEPIPELQTYAWGSRGDNAEPADAIEL